MLQDDEPPTVGVITPFREQHTLLSKFLFGHPQGRAFEDRLRLKVMTFDSCQGEERQVIFYSMVATPGNDALNYIFPVSMDGNVSESIEEKLKIQRLNVGFSRAQEMIWFVHSMPLGLFRGSIAGALNHYQDLVSKGEKVFGATDPSSPMESKVLQWLQQTEFYQSEEDDLEVLPQFPIGDYLKQLDPTYQHPRWRVDFLLTYTGSDRPLYIVIEYDGFQEHFDGSKDVHVGNHERYLREADVERQLTLESYGYRFIRINRFNLGKDPVSTLNARIESVVRTATGSTRAKASDQIQRIAEGLTNGDMKACPRCGQVKKVREFYRKELGNGAGGYGRNCNGCNTATPKGPSSGSLRGSFRRKKKWRRW
jgi:very-short-patch-repair endonuclease